MKAGKLRDSITIESRSESPNSVGDSIETWSDFATVWAEVLNQTGKEFISAREQHSELTHVVTIRYLAGVTPQMRINHGGVYLNILSVIDPNNRKQQLRLLCNEQL